MPAFRLSHAWVVRDLTPIATIDRRVRLPLSKWRGHEVGFCSWLMSAMFSPALSALSPTPTELPAPLSYYDRPTRSK